MGLLEILNPNEEEKKWLAIECFRRAAACFEQAQMWRDAAECWADAGETGRAATLYHHLGDHRQAAPLLLAAGRYTEAGQSYRAWLADVDADDRLGQVTARLGLAASLHLAVRRQGRWRESAATEAEARQHYQVARQLVEQESGGKLMLAGWCWEALGRYGVSVGRYDLIQIGYERALACFSKQHNADRVRGERYNAERVRAAQAYRAAVAGNRLLRAELKERLAEWQPERARREWERLRDEIEQAGFRDGQRDVLHFAAEEQQLAAWQQLAKLEDDPDQAAIEEYLRDLTPEGMIYIPAGPFLMGSAAADPDADDDEKPQHEVRLAGYYLGRYPLTNAEYRGFMEAGGYQEPGYWTETGWARKEQENWSQPRYWADGRFNGPQQPVVGVSWYEAAAYCRWRGGRLPTEAEWEKAADWDPATNQKRRYPWGDAWDERRCNINRREGDRTSPVGHYSPQGDSCYGCGDMLGNVWEWCSTRWTGFEYPYDPSDGREELEGGDNMWRIVRGFSWFSSGDDLHKRARCAYRNGVYPWDWIIYWGFRILAPRRLTDSEF